MEGYIDVIILSQYGIKNAVSTLGSNLTTEQIKKCYEITNTIIICYDGDFPGKSAMRKSIKKILPFLKDGRNAKFLDLPNKEDPDSLIKKIGKEGFKKMIKKSLGIFDYIFKILFTKIRVLNDFNKIYICKVINSLIELIPGKNTRSVFFSKLGKKIGILDAFQIRNMFTYTGEYEKNTLKVQYSSTKILIALLLENPKLYRIVANLNSLKNACIPGIKIFIDMLSVCKKNPKISTKKLLKHYKKKRFYKKMKTLSSWNHMIEKKEIEKVFLNNTKKVLNSILENRRNFLIFKERKEGLKKEEKRELWSISKKIFQNRINGI
ncbi:toprim domain-containing protein [bacterium endosymbiont of Pedicinus badii]|uniref:DNA primase n=1 Tax=bacterium endosymbiont of Pedicinus badii TaxID=1719126 RepID=UPI0009B940A2|nr:toprim domain-containing protein [bacterium endosymbiont of Pedicinus badii]OQM34156.1 hypothetical protein AOQ89_02345 [bacterium endosymbiont of Pedicinus badii]